MRAGDLDTRITIWRKVVTKDPTYGSAIVTRVPLVAEPGSPVVARRFWAQVQDALPSRSESVRQGMELARNQTRIRIRYRPDVTSAMEITVHRGGDVDYQIVGGPAVLGRREWLELVCERYSS